ncbi:MAG: hydrogen peroxide-inducible genes activator [Gammaproteobacteria bacterium]|nr:hydrogen peroxide-inducible genes activator [Gammaproteobacteria bacterium]
MTFTELRYIVAVARERHFGRAAQACFVSQPTLSVGVRKLEEELGVQIFERQASEVSVTAAGQAIIEQAQRVLEESEKIKTLAQHGQNQLVGELKLGAIYTVGPYLLPHIVPKLRRLAPEMPLLIEENYTARLAEQLKRGDLDVIIISLPFNHPGVTTWPLYEEPFVVLLPPGHALQQKKSIRSRELARENMLLLGSGHCFRDQVLEACPECATENAGDGIRSSVQGSSLETIRYMVSSGLGVTVLPATSLGTAQTPKRANRLFIEKPFSGKTPQRIVALAWRSSFPRPEAIEVLRRAIMECHMRGVTYLDFEPPSEKFAQ